MARTILTADQTYYVDLDHGSDTNDGLTAATAFASIYHGYELVVVQGIDTAGYNITFQLAASSRFYDFSSIVGEPVGGGSVIFQGVSADRTQVKGDEITLGDVQGPSNLRRQFYIKSMQLNSVYARGSGSVVTLSNVDCASWLWASYGGEIDVSGDYTIIGAASSQPHLHADHGGLFHEFGTVTLLSSYAYAPGFAWAHDGGCIEVSTGGFSGSATGRKFLVERGGNIDTHGHGLGFFPGDTDGIVYSGHYDSAQRTPTTFADMTDFFSGLGIGDDNALTEGTLWAFTDSVNKLTISNLITMTPTPVSVTGGGSNHVLGYFDGSNWWVVAPLSLV